MTSLICDSERRRETVRQNHKLHGLDYLEVGAGQTTLTVHFLGKAPHGSHKLTEKNVVIEGGRRIRDITVLSAVTHRSNDPEFDDTLEVTVNHPGDFSTYTLRIVARDSQGHPHHHPSFDPLYDAVDFNFKVDCPSDLDCASERQCPPEERNRPEISYLAKDYSSFRQLILDRLALIMPDWQERHVPDIGIALVELLAYAGDYLSYYQDAVATEAYLDTARLRISVRRHARLVDYQLHEGCNARTWVTVETKGAPLEIEPVDLQFLTAIDDAPSFITGTKLTIADLEKLKEGSYETFEPMTRNTITLYESHNKMHFYTWGDRECCLERGATTAALVGKLVKRREEPPADNHYDQDYKEQESDQPQPGPTGNEARELHLEPGDVLIFEEVIGPKTGNKADADPAHRHAVRLTRVEAGTDPLNGDPIVEIEWSEEDALPFPLCISVMGPPHELQEPKQGPCEIICNVSVAIGNVILVDHGRTFEEDTDEVAVKEIVESCDCEGLVADVSRVPGKFRPTLKQTPLTFAQPMAWDTPAARSLTQDVRKALPQVSLKSEPAPSGDPVWLPQSDLLASEYGDQHFVAEIDDYGRAHLRFGDGELGRRPEAGMKFRARYRAGKGPAGNVGAGSISHIIYRPKPGGTGSTTVVKVRNPLPASGGSEPEPTAEAKLFAPHAFRQELERAIIADDYRALVERDFAGKVQRAGAALRWNGSRYEALVAVDQLGKEQADHSLLNAIFRRLHRYRRIGHDIHVQSANLVPLLIEMNVCVHPHYLRGHVKAALLDLFSNRVLADGRKGLFHPDNLSFGEGIFLSRLVSLAQSVDGVESVDVTKLERLGEGPNREIEFGVLPLGPLEVAQLDNDPSLPENGTFTLNMGGGR
jgi:hypothetical protein